MALEIEFTRILFFQRLGLSQAKLTEITQAKLEVFRIKQDSFRTKSPCKL